MDVTMRIFDRMGRDGKIHPRLAMYLGRWVPEFTVTDKRTERVWAKRQARHLIHIGGVPWWIREPGPVRSERPAQPGDLVAVGFLWDPRCAEQRICGEAVGYVEGMPLSKQEEAVRWIEALGSEKNGEGGVLVETDLEGSDDS